jgi:hypothetical protein
MEKLEWESCRRFIREVAARRLEAHKKDVLIFFLPSFLFFHFTQPQIAPFPWQQQQAASGKDGEPSEINVIVSRHKRTRRERAREREEEKIAHAKNVKEICQFNYG